MLHIYTGDGKGKTTAATGLLIRALGSGKKCGYFSFLKDESSSEILVLKELKNIQIFEFPKKVPFTWQMTDEEREELIKFYCNTMKTIKSSDLDLVVLDEGLDALCLGFIKQECIKELIRHTEVVLTGRGECKELFELADYVTEMKKIKHPYDKGIKARKGIEY